MDKQEIQLSKIYLPEGALWEVYHAHELIDYRSIPSNWIDASSVSLLLRLHPITVRAIDRHFEVVSGFRTFQIIKSLCPSTQLMEVNISNAENQILVRDAIFELVSNHLLYTCGGTEAAKQLYLILKGLRKSHQEFKQALPILQSIRDLKSALNLRNDQINSSKIRHSPLQKALESIK